MLTGRGLGLSGRLPRAGHPSSRTSEGPMFYPIADWFHIPGLRPELCGSVVQKCERYNLPVFRAARGLAIVASLLAAVAPASAFDLPYADRCFAMAELVVPNQSLDRFQRRHLEDIRARGASAGLGDPSQVRFIRLGNVPISFVLPDAGCPSCEGEAMIHSRRRERVAFRPSTYVMYSEAAVMPQRSGRPGTMRNMSLLGRGDRTTLHISVTVEGPSTRAAQFERVAERIHGTVRSTTYASSSTLHAEPCAPATRWGEVRAVGTPSRDAVRVSGSSTRFTLPAGGIIRSMTGP